MLRLIPVLLAAILLAAAAWAATAVDPRQEQLNGWAVVIKQMTATMKRSDISGPELEKLRDDAIDLADAAGALRQALAPEIEAAEERVRSLTPSADSSVPETDIIKQERADQQSALDDLYTFDQQAHIIALEAKELAQDIADNIGERFAQWLFAREESLASPDLWVGVGAALPGFVDRLARLDANWMERLASRTELSTTLLAFAAIVVVVVAVYAARLVLRAAHRLAIGEAPSRARRIATAGWILAVDVLTPLAILFALHIMLDIVGLRPGPAGGIFSAVVHSVTIFAVITSLGRGMLAPARPAWRLVDIDDAAAARTYSLAVAIAFLLALIPLVERLAEITVTPPPFADAINAAISTAAAIAFLFAMRALMRSRPASGAQRRNILLAWLPPVASLVAVAAIAAAFAGYLALAAFLVEQEAWVWVMVASVVLLIGLADIGIAAVFSPDEPIGRRLMASFSLGRPILNQLAVVLSGLARLLAMALGALAIVAPWGLDSSSVVASARATLESFKIGSITISFWGIVLGLVVFAVVVLGGRLFQSWLRNRYLPTTRLDIGLKNSILTGVNYLAVVVAIVLAATYAGLDLANIAIVAGALSVGIGFGLQSIVNNFVSGLILLAERPIRTGDWIAVGNEQGTVKRISVRATEIETFDRASVIVPNSNLISGVVKNLYLRDNSGRITIDVGVGYESDPKKVESVLLACAMEHPLILHDPQPVVLFIDFGPSALAFELQCFLADISMGGTVRSDLHYAILGRLREAGIDIPYPRQDVSLHDLPQIEKMIEELGALRAAAGK